MDRDHVLAARDLAPERGQVVDLSSDQAPRAGGIGQASHHTHGNLSTRQRLESQSQQSIADQDGVGLSVLDVDRRPTASLAVVIHGR